MSNILVGKLNCNTLTTETASYSSLALPTTLTVPTLSCTGMTASVAYVGDLQTAELQVPEFSVSTINLSRGTANTMNSTTLSADSSTMDSSTANSMTGHHMTSGGMTGATVSTADLTYTPAGYTGGIYESPNEGVFRGIGFFGKTDIGVESSGTLVSLRLQADGKQAFCQGYNTYLNQLDTGTQLGSTQAMFSVCTPGQTALRYQADGNLAIYQAGTKVWQNGSMISDARLKENVQTIDSALEKILRLDGLTFEYDQIHQGEKSCGVLLEQVREIFPECVVDDELVHLEQLVPLLVEGIKELSARHARIKALFGRTQ
jgi:hypothetical protein